MKRIQRIAALFVIIFAASFPLFTLTPAVAQNTGPEMNAYAAYDGYFKYGEWLPVWVELSNDGSDLEATVRIQVTSSDKTTVFAAPVSLPTGSRKRFPVYVLPNNFSRELEVRLMSKDRLVTSTKVTVRPQPNITYLIGLITPERGALGLVTGIELPDQNRPKIITDLAINDLPDRAEALRSFDTLILNNIDTSQLSQSQADSLAGWVSQGGRLVLGGGAGIAKTTTGLPAELLPVRLQGTLEVDALSVQDLGAFAGSENPLAQGPFIASVAQADNGRLLAGSESLPLVYESSVGSGKVDYVAFDLSGVPFNGWPGTQAFWEALLGPGSTYPQSMPFDVSMRQMRANQLYYALSNIPSLDLPSVQGLTLLLMVYIVIVGPVNYLVLRWRRRLHWAWITIPLITLLFTGGSFLIGYVMRGTDLILNQIALVEAHAGGSARVTSFMGLFSPRQQSYEIKVQGESLISPMSGYDQGPWGPGGVTTGGEMVFIQGQPSVIQGLTVNQFSMQSFMSEDLWEDFGGLSGDLQIKGEALVGTVRNDTPYTITDVVVAFQTRFVRLGDLAPGQEASVDLGLGNMTSDRFGPPLSYRIFQENFSQTGAPPRSVELKSNILNSLFDSGMPWDRLVSSSFPAKGGGTAVNLIVFGWMDQAPPEVEVSNNRLSQQTTALVYSGLDFSIASDGLLSLPVGLVPGTILSMPRDSGSCGPNMTTSVHMGPGEAEFEYQLPADFQDAQVTTLKLNVWRDSGGDWDMPDVSLWDWETNGWTTIQEPIQGVNVIQKADPYVSDDGLVRVQLNSTSNMYSCHYLDLGVEAERLTGSSMNNGQIIGGGTP